MPAARARSTPASCSCPSCTARPSARSRASRAPSGQMHPVQQAMVDHHGSQCGFCTPGFVVSMATAHSIGARDHDDALAGNLCRCTGYAPIVRAAQAAADSPVPDWMDDRTKLQSIFGSEISSGGARPRRAGGRQPLSLSSAPTARGRADSPLSSPPTPSARPRPTTWPPGTPPTPTPRWSPARRMSASGSPNSCATCRRSPSSTVPPTCAA